MSRLTSVDSDENNLVPVCENRMGERSCSIRSTTAVIYRQRHVLVCWPPPADEDRPLSCAYLVGDSAVTKSRDLSSVYSGGKWGITSDHLA